jgi:hypothetical protein
MNPKQTSVKELFQNCLAIFIAELHHTIRHLWEPMRIQDNQVIDTSTASPTISVTQNRQGATPSLFIEISKIENSKACYTWLPL